MTENQSLFFWIWKFESISTLRELRSKSYDCYAFIKAQKDVKTKYVLGMEATNWIREIWNMCHCFWHYESVPIFTYPWNNKLYKSDKKKGWINKLWLNLAKKKEKETCLLSMKVSNQITILLYCLCCSLMRNNRNLQVNKRAASHPQEKAKAG